MYTKTVLSTGLEMRNFKVFGTLVFEIRRTYFYTCVCPSGYIFNAVNQSVYDAGATAMILELHGN